MRKKRTSKIKHISILKGLPILILGTDGPLLYAIICGILICFILSQDKVLNLYIIFYTI